MPPRAPNGFRQRLDTSKKKREGSYAGEQYQGRHGKGVGKRMGGAQDVAGNDWRYDTHHVVREIHDPTERPDATLGRDQRGQRPADG